MAIKKTDTVQTVVRIIVGLVVLAFTLFGLIISQPCDIDKQYLWCRIHPMSFLDVVGILLFYAAAAFIGGFLPEKFYLEESKGTANNVFLGIGIGLVAFLLLWI